MKKGGFIFWIEIVGLIVAIAIGIMIGVTPSADKTALIWVAILGSLIGFDLVRCMMGVGSDEKI